MCANVVTNWGPLWTHAFCYGGQNRHLLQLYSSPFQVISHIARKFLAFNSLSTLCEELVFSESTVDFSERMLRFKYFLRSDGALLQGWGQHSVSISPEVEQCFVDLGNFNSNDFTFFIRVFYNGMRYTTSRYIDNKKNDSYAILRNKKVNIKYIALSPSGEILLLVQTIKCSRHSLVQMHDKLEKLKQLAKCDVSNVPH